MPAIEEAINQLAESPLKLGIATLALATAGYVFIQGLKKLSEKTKELPPPPGPPRQFLIGNLLQFPKDHFHEKFCEWQKEYGDIVSVKLPGISMVILNSYETAVELLGKRPNSTSNRKIGYMVFEVMGLQWSTAFIQPGQRHSNQRKMLRRGIGPQRVATHSQNIEKNAIKLMVALQGFEGDPHSLLLNAVGKIVIEVTYGTELPGTMNEELSSWNLELMDLINSAFFSFWFVDIFHLLRFIPSWVPGAGFKRIGIRSKWLSDKIRFSPFEKAIELHKSGKIGHSLANDLLEEFGPIEDVKDALAVLYGAGSDTTTAAIMAFINALSLFPEIAQRVYEEIISVTEGIRLPQTTDRPNLPYTEAVWKEAFRWNTFIPLGVPHVNSQDEVINGYLIKAGTLINQHNGFMMKDPKVWGDPEIFRPERFLSDDTHTLPNPLVLVFGFGTRVCPGLYLADRTGFHISMTIAALYDVTPLEGKSRPRPELAEYTDTAFRLPLDFECRFVPRNTRSLELLNAARLNE